MNVKITCFLLLFTVHMSFSQQWDKNTMTETASQHLLPAINQLQAFLSIPNNAIYPDHVRQNVIWCEEAFQQRNFQTQVLETEGPPLLLAERRHKSAKKTVLFYLQIDGQPVDSSQWDQESPYQPVLKRQTTAGKWEIISWDALKDTRDREWRIFARSASDAKGPVVMFLNALDVIDKKGFKPDYNIKVIMDFEEELGSPHLPGAVKKYQDALKSDMLVILDGPRHISNQPTLTFGARGISTVTLTVFGPRVPQHSGHYGNYTPNPALRLSQLLASMKDAQGLVTIPGYYEGISLDAATKEILRAVPDDEDKIRKKIGIAEIDRVAPNYQESIQYPSLNIRGLQSGWIGDEVRTIIPGTATAEIDVRLVKESSGERLVGLIRDHIQKRGYHFVKGEPTEEERQQHSKLISFTYEHSYGAFRTDYDSEVGKWLYKAMLRAFGKDPIRIRTSGGSIPISPFVTTLGIPAVTVPTVNRDNNQHSPNENIRLGNFEEGIRTCLSILTEGF